MIFCIGVLGFRIMCFWRSQVLCIWRMFPSISSRWEPALRGPTCDNPRETVWSRPRNANTPSGLHDLNDAVWAAVSARGAVGECLCTASVPLQIEVFLDRTSTVVIVALVTYPANILFGSGTRLYCWPNPFRLTSNATIDHIAESSDMENFFSPMQFSSLNRTKSFEANSIIWCAHDENGRMS